MEYILDAEYKYAEEFWKDFEFRNLANYRNVYITQSK